ncbi:mechanosensitive ion channel family protein [Paenibacillus sp. MB22_1]|uniref:mechanosensitive ion channel family protein n=1 Tax=unclassified Paenibacillus TaxID=185978 RepID=UPI0001AFD0BE|nr:mechanosensitive ion channel family protein [Paenibacillus sp. oral taxon 786]EES74053.1 transporter, small conductance mechanosensitive ion channel MscS family protein [Paenibacillus sp. oral taxon 786 str. D14]
MNDGEGFLDFFTQLGWVNTGITIGIIALFALFNKGFVKLTFTLLNRRRTAAFGGREVWRQVLERPFRWLFILIGLEIGLKYLLPRNVEIAVGLDPLFRSGVIALIGWGMYILSAQSSVMLEGLSRKIRLDDASMLIPFLSKVLRIVVVIITVALIGAEWGFSINGLVAGMGLGSLAVALAAKDTLGNIFGGIVIILEKPFSKGDWILTPTAEGTVEDITFRSTKIRTFADAVITVPNAQLADQPITNWSKMGKRRVTFTLPVALDSDRERMMAAIHRIEQLLRDNEQIDPGTIFVKFTDFNESSLGIFIYYFTRSTVWGEYLSVRQEMNLAFMQVLEEEGIKLAYPAQRVFFESAPETSGEVDTTRSRQYEV